MNHSHGVANRRRYGWSRGTSATPSCDAVSPKPRLKLIDSTDLPSTPARARATACRSVGRRASGRGSGSAGRRPRAERKSSISSVRWPLRTEGMHRQASAARPVGVPADPVLVRAADAEAVPVAGEQAHVLARRDRLDQVGHEVHVAAGRVRDEARTGPRPRRPGRRARRSGAGRRSRGTKPRPVGVVVRQRLGRQPLDRGAVGVHPGRVADRQQRAEPLDPVVGRARSGAAQPVQAGSTDPPGRHRPSRPTAGSLDRHDPVALLPRGRRFVVVT